MLEALIQAIVIMGMTLAITGLICIGARRFPYTTFTIAVIALTAVLFIALYMQ